MFVESFLFGSVNGLHCAGMCGPLAAAVAAGPGGIAAYHGARLSGYAGVGAVLGGAGALAGTDRIAPPAASVSFLLALALVALALLGHARLPSLGALPIAGRAMRALLALPPAARAAGVGLLTPLLPCGLLLAVHGAALATGSAGLGATTALGFAAGSAVVLAAVQAPLAWLRARLAPTSFLRLQQVLLLGAALVLAWRGWLALAGTDCCAQVDAGV